MAAELLPVVLLELLSMSGCMPTKPKAPRSVQPSEPAPHHLDAAAMHQLPSLEGKTVTLAGRISEIPWQHLIGSFETHPHISYFDVGDQQIVIYTKTRVEGAQRLQITGQVVEVRGDSKRPDGSEQHAEHHVLVDAWRQLE